MLGVAEGLDYAALPGWIELKLSSGRAKDRTHVVEVLKVIDPQSAAQIALHLERVHETYAQLFRQLAAEADEERRQEETRGRR